MFLAAKIQRAETQPKKKSQNNRNSSGGQRQATPNRRESPSRVLPDTGSQTRKKKRGGKRYKDKQKSDNNHNSKDENNNQQNDKKNQNKKANKKQENNNAPKDKQKSGNNHNIKDENNNQQNVNKKQNKKSNKKSNKKHENNNAPAHGHDNSNKEFETKKLTRKQRKAIGRLKREKLAAEEKKEQIKSINDGSAKKSKKRMRHSSPQRKNKKAKIEDRKLQNRLQNMTRNQWIELLHEDHVLNDLVDARIRVLRVRREKPMRKKSKLNTRRNAPFKTFLADMEPFSGDTVSSVCIIGHLHALMVEKIPDYPETHRYVKMLDQIEKQLVSNRAPRTQHTYYGNIRSFQESLITQFVSHTSDLGIQVRNCIPNGTKETFTKTMISDMCLFASHNPDGVLVLVLSDVKTFSNTLHRLKALKIRMILIVAFELLDNADMDILHSVGATFFNIRDLFKKGDQGISDLYGYDPSKQVDRSAEVIVVEDDEEEEDDEVEIIDLLDDDEEERESGSDENHTEGREEHSSDDSIEDSSSEDNSLQDADDESSSDMRIEEPAPFPLGTPHQLDALFSSSSSDSEDEVDGRPAR